MQLSVYLILIFNNMTQGRAQNYIISRCNNIRAALPVCCRLFVSMDEVYSNCSAYIDKNSQWQKWSMLYERYYNE